MRLRSNMAAVLVTSGFLACGFGIGPAHGSAVTQGPWSNLAHDYWHDNAWYGTSFDDKSDDKDKKRYQFERRHAESYDEDDDDPRWDDDWDRYVFKIKHHRKDSTLCWTFPPHKHPYKKHHHHHDPGRPPVDTPTVPIPGAALLFGSGLAFLGLKRRIFPKNPASAQPPKI